MQINYKIFSHWRELDNVPEANNFMCYQIRTGQVVALAYDDMRKLFLLNSKRDILRANADLLSGLQEALNNGNNSGAVTLTGD